MERGRSVVGLVAGLLTDWFDGWWFGWVFRNCTSGRVFLRTGKTNSLYPCYCSPWYQEMPPHGEYLTIAAFRLPNFFLLSPPLACGLAYARVCTCGWKRERSYIY